MTSERTYRHVGERRRETHDRLDTTVMLLPNGGGCCWSGPVVNANTPSEGRHCPAGPSAYMRRPSGGDRPVFSVWSSSSRLICRRPVPDRCRTGAIWYGLSLWSRRLERTSTVRWRVEKHRVRTHWSSRTIRVTGRHWPAGWSLGHRVCSTGDTGPSVASGKSWRRIATRGWSDDDVTHRDQICMHVDCFQSTFCLMDILRVHWTQRYWRSARTTVSFSVTIHVWPALPDRPLTRKEEQQTGTGTVLHGSWITTTATCAHWWFSLRWVCAFSVVNCTRLSNTDHNDTFNKLCRLYYSQYATLHWFTWLRSRHRPHPSAPP